MVSNKNNWNLQKIQTMHTILIIEDEPRVASLLKNGLEENGYQTMIAYDGVMGLRLFRVHTFDLVISDIILPKMDGFELCKEIRKTNPGIPILMLTALGSTDDKLDGFDAGADDYMVKPFDFRELYARIRVLLKRNNEATAPQPREIRYSDLYIDLQGKKCNPKRHSHQTFTQRIQPVALHGRECRAGSQPHRDSRKGLEYPL